MFKVLKNVLNSPPWHHWGSSIQLCFSTIVNNCVFLLNRLALLHLSKWIQTQTAEIDKVETSGCGVGLNGVRSLRTFGVFIGLLLRNAQHEAATDKTIVSSCGTFELLSQVCLVCQRTAGLCKQIWVHTLRRTHPANTKMPFCLMSNRGLPLQTQPFLLPLFFSFFPPSIASAYANLTGWQHPVSRKHLSGWASFSVLCHEER